MLDDEDFDEEEEAIPGEQPPLLGEGAPPLEPTVPVPEVISDKALTFEEASRYLNTLGKDESGVRYAYLMITAINKKLTDVSIILNFKHVLFIDLSGNYLTLEKLQVLCEMPYLVMLRADSNRIESAALRRMPYLQVLTLARNQILDTSDIDQPILEALDLSYNQIYKAEFDHLLLENIKVLDLHGNYLYDLNGTYPTTVEKLYVAENNITKIGTGLIQLHQLKVLHLRNNKIRKLNGFSPDMAELTYLNLRQNAINKFRQFRKLQCLPQLETLIVLANPVSGMPGEVKGEGAADEEEPEEEMMGEEEVEPVDKCVLPLLVLLPNLRRINKHTVTLEERDFANSVRQEKLEEIMGEVSSDDDEDVPSVTDYTVGGEGEYESVDNVKEIVQSKSPNKDDVLDMF